MRARWKVVIAVSIAIFISPIVIILVVLIQPPPNLSVRNDLHVAVQIDCGDNGPLTKPGAVTKAPMIWAPSGTTCPVFRASDHHFLACMFYDGTPGRATVLLTTYMNDPDRGDCP
jgi:hypothetical protein